MHEGGDFEDYTGADGKPYSCCTAGVIWSQGLEPHIGTKDMECSVDEGRPERTELQYSMRKMTSQEYDGKYNYGSNSSTT